MKPVELSVTQSVFARGHLLTVIPKLAIEHGLMESLVYLQIKYLATKSKSKNSARISYGRLQKTHFPFIQRRWVIELIHRLETAGLVQVENSGRINVFKIPELINSAQGYDFEMPDYDEEAWEKKKKKSSIEARMQVSVQLAERIGLKEALILQQVHLRHMGADGSKWAIRSYEDWQKNTFMFLGIATVKRLFAKLAKENLLFVKKHSGECGVVNSYRVNYVRVAELLDVPLPHVDPHILKFSKGFDFKQMEWIHPLYPLSMQDQLNASTVS